MGQIRARVKMHLWQKHGESLVYVWLNLGCRIWETYFPRFHFPEWPIVDDHLWPRRFPEEKCLLGFLFSFIACSYLSMVGPFLFFKWHTLFVGKSYCMEINWTTTFFHIWLQSNHKFPFPRICIERIRIIHSYLCRYIYKNSHSHFNSYFHLI